MSKIFSSFLVSFNTVVPIVIMMAIGTLLKKKKTISDAFEVEANRVVFNWALPMYLFNTLYNTSIEEGFSLRLVLLGMGVSILFLTALMLITPKFYENRPRRGAFISCAVHGGAVFPGIIICESLLSPGDSVPFLLALPFWAVSNNIYSILMYSIYSPGQVRSKEALGFLIKQIGKNPIIWGVVGGTAANLIRLRMPDFLTTVIGYLSGLTTPLALITLGARVEWDAFKQDFRDSFTSAALIKLVLLPAIGCLIAGALAAPPNEIVALFIHWGTPVGISVFSIAVALNGDSRLVGNSIIVSSIMSCLTLLVGIFILSMLGQV